MKNTVITVTEPVQSVKKEDRMKEAVSKIHFYWNLRDSNPMWVYTESLYPDCLTCCFWWQWESMWLVVLVWVWGLELKWIPEILLLLSLTLLTHNRESIRKHFWVEINIWYVFYMTQYMNPQDVWPLKCILFLSVCVNNLYLVWIIYLVLLFLTPAQVQEAWRMTHPEMKCAEEGPSFCIPLTSPHKMLLHDMSKLTPMC